MKNYQFHTHMFLNELLRMMDEGQSVPIQEVCNHIEEGTIYEFIQGTCGFKNVNVGPDMRDDIDFLLREKYVSENEAANKGINRNGLAYLALLLLDDVMGCLGNAVGLKAEYFRNT